MGRNRRRRPRPLAQRELLSAGARLFFSERAKSAAAAAGCGRKCTLRTIKRYRSERAHRGTLTLYCPVQSSVYSENAAGIPRAHVCAYVFQGIGLCAGLKAFTALRERDLKKRVEIFTSRL